MINKPDKNKIRVARHRRTRKNIMGTAECPRMDVFRSNSHIYVQLIDDAAGRTLVASSTLDPAIRDQVKENVQGGGRQAGRATRRARKLWKLASSKSCSIAEAISTRAVWPMWQRALAKPD